MEKLAKDLYLKISGISKKPKGTTYAIKKIRLGMYKSWIPSVEEGWTRLIFEKYEFPYFSIYDADIRAGNLEKSYDVVIIPDTYRPEMVINGYSKGTMPPKYAGGITLNGLRNLKQFVENGGTLIFMNSVCNLAIDHFGLPARNILKKIKREEFVCEGSLLRMEFDTGHPIAYGMQKETATVFADSCVFEILPSFKERKEPKSVAKYPDENPLMSGWIYGDKIIRQKTTILDVPYGNGKIILLGFPVQFRAQPYVTFKILFNSIFYGGMNQ